MIPCNEIKKSFSIKRTHTRRPITVCRNSCMEWDRESDKKNWKHSYLLVSSSSILYSTIIVVIKKKTLMRSVLVIYVRRAVSNHIVAISHSASAHSRNTWKLIVGSAIDWIINIELLPANATESRNRKDEEEDEDEEAEIKEPKMRIVIMS